MIGNDLEKLQKPDSALYTQFINENGGTVDDLIVYRRQNDYLLVVNASNIDKDWQWLNCFVPNFAGVELYRRIEPKPGCLPCKDQKRRQ